MGSASRVPSPSFAEIAERLIAGDDAAVELLYEKFTKPFTRFLLSRYGLSEGTAHDLTQDSLLQMMEKLRSGACSAPEKRPRGTDWAFGFVSNNAKMYLRKKSVRRARSVEEMAEDEAAGLKDPKARRPESLLDLREKAETLDRIKKFAREEIEKTRGRRREILDRFLGGMKVVEIARELGIDPDTCQEEFARTRDRIVSVAQARALGLGLPEPKPVTHAALSDTLSRLPKHEREIGRLACLEGLWKTPEEIAKRTGYDRKLVEANLELLWRFLGRRYHREFPEALKEAEIAPR